MNVNSSELTEEEQTRILGILIDDLIPTNSNEVLPGAVEVSVLDNVIGNGISDGLAEVLLDLDQKAIEFFSTRYYDVDVNQRFILLNKDVSLLRKLNEVLGFDVLRFYFRDRSVIEGLNLEYRSPFPKGYSLPDNKFDLLESVRKRPPFFVRV